MLTPSQDAPPSVAALYHAYDEALLAYRNYPTHGPTYDPVAERAARDALFAAARALLSHTARAT